MEEDLKADLLSELRDLREWVVSDVSFSCPDVVRDAVFCRIGHLVELSKKFVDHG